MRHFLRTNRFYILALVGLAILVYFNALDNELVSDDIASIAQDPTITDFSYVTSHLVAPVRRLLYWLAYQISGDNPFFYRLINVGFHLGSTILLFTIVSLMHNKKTAFFAAALFSVHPLLVESVTWISGGAYSQAAFFALLSLLLYLLSEQRFKLYVLSVVSFFLALTSQITPLALVPFLVIYEHTNRTLLTRWKKLVSYIVLSLMFVIYTASNIGERTVTLSTMHYQIPEENNMILVSALSITTYLQLIVWPSDLTIYHSEFTLNNAEYYLRVVALVIVFGILAVSFFKSKPIFLWGSFFIAALLPTVVAASRGLVWIVAERYVYLASIGIFVIAGYIIAKLSSIKKIEPLVYVAITLIILGLSIRTIIRNQDWQTVDNLWLSAQHTSPSSPNNHNNLGDLYGRRGDFNRAVAEFKLAIQLKPNYADAYHNLGNTYVQMNETELALRSYLKAIEFNPQLWQSYQNIAAVYFADQKYEESEKYIRQALLVAPQISSLHYNLAVVLIKLQKTDEARKELEYLLSFDPSNQQIRDTLKSLNIGSSK